MIIEDYQVSFVNVMGTRIYNCKNLKKFIYILYNLLSMHVAIIGPVCKDKNIIDGKTYSQIGGVVYYTGHSLTLLGTDVTIFASYGPEKQNWLEGLKCKRINHIKAENTIEFINEYSKDNPDMRIQKAKIYNNEINFEDVQEYNFNEFDYIILGSLFHNNISDLLIKQLSNNQAKIILTSQGIIRYLDGDKIVWKNPNKVIDILPFIDYLFLNEKELEFITKKKDISESIKILQKKGVQNIIITQGEKGSLISLENNSYKIKSYPPKILVDPTGAGDCYLAGFIKALELFDNPVKQGDFAAMTSTISIEQIGPFNKSVHEIYQRLHWK